VRGGALVADDIDLSVHEGLEEQASDEDRENGLDIADFILRAKIQEAPELANVEVPKRLVKKAEVPAFDNLFKKKEKQIITTAGRLEDLTPTEEEVATFGMKKPEEEAKKEIEIQGFDWDDDVTSDID